MTTFRTALNAIGITAGLLGFGISLGSQQCLWRYGHGFGERFYNVNRWLVRRGAVAAVLGLVLMGVAAVLSLFGQTN